MRPYGERKKIRRNIPDVHPQKGYTMWWKIDWVKTLKGRARQEAKQELRKEIENGNN